VTHAYAAAALAFGFGLVAGLRSMIAPTALAVAQRSPLAAALFGLAAIGELVVDKLPRTPSRLKPAPLAVRCLVGASCGYILVGGILGGMLGLAGALAGSYGGAALRTARPSIVFAFVEDAAAVGLAACLAVLSQ
jgi:uncharacterized membrane protein